MEVHVVMEVMEVMRLKTGDLPCNEKEPTAASRVETLPQMKCNFTHLETVTLRKPLYRFKCKFIGSAEKINSVHVLSGSVAASAC